MNNERRKRLRVRVIYAVAAAIVAISAVMAYNVYAARQDKALAPSAGPAGEAALSAWLADWQWQEGARDLQEAAAGLDSLQLFAAYFDESDRLTFTDSFKKELSAVREAAAANPTMRMDLTIVNDILFEDGHESQKDSDLVSRLLAERDERSRHVNEIMAAANQYGFGGVELDYEKIDERDWGRFSLLVFELYTKLKAQGKTLRVVLEPRAPVEKLKLPSGPTYVMMAYNLYGNHSEPGPKADKSFIRKLAARLSNLPGDPYLAFATGGFDWTGGKGTATGVTELQAVELAKRSAEPPQRDASSGSLKFQYKDDEGVKHTVWYADEQTISWWIELAKLAGHNKVAIWRLGGLGDGTNQFISAFQQK
ncbi:hypothetical protein PCCS19_04770 [Paenibacillus sp. CCS19]|uniref:glycosyl hydrolase family 18 protein n=1 Tax=Paenibacillus sp. CCS19 TaxID=3158387 RepID=UPI002563518B|nr:glycosyl hydrolase family 18 protein [Paenibacillus cellulosilyticus]GMK37423.1 hypothetical protein PCCS19_04770 [Paenibacillus cellulosilyticus]